MATYWPVYEETIGWTNNHGGHADEEWCEYEIYGYTGGAWSLQATGTTYIGGATPGTQGANVSNPGRMYSKWKVRIRNTHMSCGDTYKYSSYTSDITSAITSNPCVP